MEICYIGMLHPFHYENAKTALLNGKHVLVEKPSTCLESDTQSLVRLVRVSISKIRYSFEECCPSLPPSRYRFHPVSLLESSSEVAPPSSPCCPRNQAKEKDLFLLEGMWTRFFPAVEKARELVDSGVIGDVVEIHSDFGINGVDLGKYPDDILYQPKLGGGALFYVAPYPVAAAIGFLGRGPPSRIAAAGVMDKLTGVNLSLSISLHFKGRGIACLAGSLQVWYTTFLWAVMFLSLWLCRVLPAFYMLTMDVRLVGQWMCCPGDVLLRFWGGRLTVMTTFSLCQWVTWEQYSIDAPPL